MTSWCGDIVEGRAQCHRLCARREGRRGARDELRWYGCLDAVVMSCLIASPGLGEAVMAWTEPAVTAVR